MTPKRLSGIVVCMNLKSLLSGLLLAIFMASCKKPANVPESVLTPTPKPNQTATVPPIPSPTATQPPTPTPIPSARIESGDHALFIGDWENALVEYQSAFDASSDPDVQSAALLGIGRAWLLARNYFEATNILEDLIQNYPDSAHIAEANLTLGHAQEAQEHYSEAADAYLNYLVLRPGVVDGYILNLRADALFAAGDYGGAALDYQAAAQSPSLLDSILLQMKTARALAISKEYQNALALYDEIFSQTEDDDTRALINLRKGQIYASLGETELAWTAYLDAVVNYPQSYNSYSALIELVDAGAPVDELERGIVDYYADQHGVALAALDRYLQNDPADPATGLYFFGLASRALGGHEEAIEKWDLVINNYPDSTYWDEVWEAKAFTQWYYLEQYQDAIQTLLDFADLVPTHSRAAEFIFDAAGLPNAAGTSNALLNYMNASSTSIQRMSRLNGLFSWPGYHATEARIIRALEKTSSAWWKLGALKIEPQPCFGSAKPNPYQGIRKPLKVHGNKLPALTQPDITAKGRAIYFKNVSLSHHRRDSTSASISRTNAPGQKPGYVQLSVWLKTPICRA